MKTFFIALMALFCSGCLGMPNSITPVAGFEIDRYLGKWYEIARLDHSFERGLDHVTAEYSLDQDGSVKVVNRGFSAEDNTWKEARGKALFVGKSTEGYLRVSFFGPFFGSYVIFDLDSTHYQYAFVSGPDTSYLWLLSRTPSIDNELVSRFITKASSKGFNTNKLIFPNQSQGKSVSREGS